MCPRYRSTHSDTQNSVVIRPVPSYRKIHDTPFITHSFVSVVDRLSPSSSLLVLSSTTNISLCDRLLSLTHHGVFIVEKGENTSSNTETDVRSELFCSGTRSRTRLEIVWQRHDSRSKNCREERETCRVEKIRYCSHRTSRSRRCCSG